MTITKPGYYDAFRCIASACPDSCCKEWDVQVDAASAAYYRQLPGSLGDRLRQVLREEDGETVMTIEDGRCPMWRRDGLCRIQAELGEQALCQVCREFPRLRHDYGDFVELGLELSCPEAARLILGADHRMVTEVREEEGQGDYDEEAMEVLKETREIAWQLLESHDAAEALTLLLLYGYQAQEELDSGQAEPFDPVSNLETAEALAKPYDMEGFLQFFRELEILTETWKAMLDAPRKLKLEPQTNALARYLIGRYWLQAISDYDLVCRVKFIVISCLLVGLLGGSFPETAQLYSKEIENDADNVDAILDAAYTIPAFTDDRLLGMLLAGGSRA